MPSSISQAKTQLNFFDELDEFEDEDETIKKTLKKEYKLNSIAKIRIFGRELYPLKTFSNQFQYTYWR